MHLWHTGSRVFSLSDQRISWRLWKKMLNTGERGGLQKRKRQLVCDSLFLKDVGESFWQFSVKANIASINVLHVVSLQHSKTRVMKLMLKRTMKLLLSITVMAWLNYGTCSLCTPTEHKWISSAFFVCVCFTMMCFTGWLLWMKKLLVSRQPHYNQKVPFQRSCIGIAVPVVYSQPNSAMPVISLFMTIFSVNPFLSVYLFNV